MSKRVESNLKGKENRSKVSTLAFSEILLVVEVSTLTMWVVGMKTMLI